MRREAPSYYNRKENEVLKPSPSTDAVNDEQEEDGGEGDNDEDDNNNADDLEDAANAETINDNADDEDIDISPTDFDEAEAERTLMGHWQRSSATNNEHTIVLGTGAVGTATNQWTRNANEPIYLPVTTRSSNGHMTAEAQIVLTLFQQQSKASKPIAAADVTQAEDILRHIALSVDTDNPSYDTLLSSIAAGNIGIAGSLLLSQAYAPRNTNLKSNDDSSDDNANNKDPICPICGEDINSETAPDGAVGCLGGHAMHPACAADLLLGGGNCPTC